MYTRSVAPPEYLIRVETELREEVFRQNRMSQHRLAITHTPLDFLAAKPLGIEVLPQPSAQMSPVRQVDIRLFANPDAGAFDWTDEATDLGESASLMLLFEEVPVRARNGETTIQDIVEKEFVAILDRNPGLRARMHVSTAGEFAALAFRREYAHHKVMWIEGDLPNFKVKRAMVLALDVAYAALMSDPRYAEKKPSGPPTNH
jgi:hypothetical protein